MILPFYLKSGREKYILYLNGHHYFPYKGFIYTCLGFSLVFYGLRTLFYIKRNSKSIDGRRTKLVHLKWVKHYTLLFLTISLCYIICLSIISFSYFHHFEVFLSIILIFSLLIHFVGFRAIIESNIISEKPTIKSNKLLSDEKTSYIKKEIIYLLEVDEVYTKNDLSSQFFTTKLQINTQYLSYVINNEFNCNLTHLINSYRIVKAKQMINDKDYNHLNLLGIAMEVGFNTKNTFIRAFKKHTGMTPTKYKASLFIFS
ncbi:helix-turn-helix domain-containing protein [uncultured Winogradskyella sp.]|uniref:helix-turn-helix domain-containing protein n=1 Tax=uncultured Winogradskyella sp. TaxID=395353 RepID=UPI0026229A9A|nr:helix-turn-helix domain-containing protein [uncultured Winogradskyella sp.]